MVQQTLWGNLILGPTARDVHVKEAMEESTQQIHQFILAKCAKLVKPGTFDPKVNKQRKKVCVLPVSHTRYLSLRKSFMLFVVLEPNHLAEIGLLSTVRPSSA